MGIEIQPIDGHAFAREVIGAQLWRGFEPADVERIREICHLNACRGCHCLTELMFRGGYTHEYSY